jgi:hypothetical protein
LFRRPGEPFVLVTGRSLEHVRQRLPGEFQVLASVPYFLKRDTLVLLGRREGTASEVDSGFVSGDTRARTIR